MRKILLIAMLLVLVAVPAFAGNFGYNISATSYATVRSGSIAFDGSSGTFAGALNTSIAWAAKNGSGEVSTYAETSGETLTEVTRSGFAFGMAMGFQTGSAFADAWNSK